MSFPVPPLPPAWPVLSTTARDAVVRIAKLLAGGFTGTIEIECRDGGVGRLRETRVHDLARSNGRT